MYGSSCKHISVSATECRICQTIENGSVDHSKKSASALNTYTLNMDNTYDDRFVDEYQYVGAKYCHTAATWPSETDYTWRLLGLNSPADLTPQHCRHQCDKDATCTGFSMHVSLGVCMNCATSSENWGDANAYIAWKRDPEKIFSAMDSDKECQNPYGHTYGSAWTGILTYAGCKDYCREDPLCFGISFRLVGGYRCTKCPYGDTYQDKTGTHSFYLGSETTSPNALPSYPDSYTYTASVSKYCNSGTWYPTRYNDDSAVAAYLSIEGCRDRCNADPTCNGFSMQFTNSLKHTVYRCVLCTGATTLAGNSQYNTYMRARSRQTIKIGNSAGVACTSLTNEFQDSSTYDQCHDRCRSKTGCIRFRIQHANGKCGLCASNSPIIQNSAFYTFEITNEKSSSGYITAHCHSSTWSTRYNAGTSGNSALSPVANLENCKKKCDEDSDCFAATFSTHYNLCVLCPKDSVLNTDPNARWITSTDVVHTRLTGYELPEQSYCHSTTWLTRFNGASTFGDHLTDVGCRDYCNADDACTGFSLWTNSNTKKIEKCIKCYVDSTYIGHDDYRTFKALDILTDTKGCHKDTSENNIIFNTVLAEGECSNTKRCLANGCAIGKQLVGSTCTTCPSGKHQPLTTGFTCLDCQSGEYQNLAGQGSCETCDAGSVTLNANNEPVDAGATQCNQCVAGTYDDDGVTNTPCKSCPTGQFQDQDGQTGCKTCAAGSEVNVAATQCNQCVAGTYDDDGVPSTACQSCPAGQFQDAAGQTGCKTCVAGTYQDQQGQTQCKDCGPHTYQPNEGEASCDSCEQGNEARNDLNTVVSTGATQCIACSPGKYAGEFGSRSSCRHCDPGSETLKSGEFTLEGATQCRQCTGNKYDDDENSSTRCKVCDTGNGIAVNNDTGLKECNMCTGDTYSDTGASCNTCLSGSTLGGFLDSANKQGATQCTPCAAGTFDHDNNTATACENCPTGQFQDAAGQSSCKSCTNPGYFLDNFVDATSKEGARECNQCTAGTFDHDNNPSTACQSCPTGQFQDENGKTECKNCTAGTYQDQQGQLECKDCETGTFQPDEGKTSCSPWSPTFQQCNEITVDDLGNTGMKFTPGNTTTNSECSLCPEGYNARSASSETDGTECNRCSAGYGGNGTHCNKCAVTQYQAHNSLLDEACADKECPLGQGVGNSTNIEHLDEKDDCFDCGKGTYSDSETTGQCGSCDGNKQPQETNTIGGDYVNAGGKYCVDCPAGKEGINGKCELCEAGTFNSVAGSVAGLICKSCDTPNSQPQETNTIGGDYVNAGGKYCVACPEGMQGVNGKCELCPSGYSNNATGSSCTLCEGDTQSQVSDTGNIFANEGGIYCVDCPAGMQGGNGTCVPCEAGYSNNATGSSCTLCQGHTQSQVSDTGNVFAIEGGIYCVDCPAGMQGNGEGKCEFCPPGQSNQDAGSSCTLCEGDTQSQVSDTGNEFANEGGIYCVDCPAGMQGVNGTCVSCEAGYSNNATGSSCTLCQGHTQSQVSDTGNVFAIEGGKYCVDCPAGMQGNGEGKCEFCPPGHSNQDAGSSCTLCQGHTQSQVSDTGNEFAIEGGIYCVPCQMGTEGVNGKCEACTGASYGAGVGQGCTSCDPGTESAPNGLRCKPCKRGTYRNGNMPECVAWTSKTVCDQKDNGRFFFGRGSSIRDTCQEKRVLDNGVLKKVSELSGTGTVPITAKSVSYKTCSDLDFGEELVIEDDAEAIVENAVASCTKLKRVRIGTKVKSIGKAAFKNANIEKVRIPDAVETIDEEAFQGNEQLTDIVIGSSVKEVKARAFEGGAKHRKVTVLNTSTIIDATAFDSNSIDQFCGGRVSDFGITNAMSQESQDAQPVCAPCKDTEYAENRYTLGCKPRTVRKNVISRQQGEDILTDDEWIECSDNSIRTANGCSTAIPIIQNAYRKGGFCKFTAQYNVL